MAVEVTTLTGRSGTAYAFEVFPRATRFQAKPSVYVMGRSSGDSRFAVCYVGHTADLSRRPLQADKTPCFQRFGVDHIFVLEELDAARRAKIVDDLVQAYAPICNAP